MIKLAALPDSREVHPPQTQLERLWKPRALAEWWGGCSRQAIYDLISQGDLEAIRVAGSLKVTESSALAYIARCKGAR